ncbi:MAG: phage tail protein [Deltaproteobacteria bacterium]|nr:phage tail protein [Deltaproteobacteria bacterium]
MFRFLQRRRGGVLTAALSVALLVPIALVLGAHEGTARDHQEPWAQAPRASARFDFVVERNGTVFGRFQEVSGLSNANEVVEFREGGDPGVVRKIPGRLKYADITLKRGIVSGDLSLWEWREQVETDFSSARSDLVVRMVDMRGTEHAIWHFTNAWPSRVSGPQARSDGNDIAVETLDLVHEGVVRVQ